MFASQRRDLLYSLPSEFFREMAQATAGSSPYADSEVFVRTYSN